MSHLLQVLLLLSLVIAAAKLGGAAANRLGQPVSGEILIGLILGPTLLNVLGWPVFRESAAGGGLDSHGPLLGLLSPFVEQITYVVRLTDDFTGVWREVGAGHFYDLSDMAAHPMGYAP